MTEAESSSFPIPRLDLEQGKQQESHAHIQWVPVRAHCVAERHRSGVPLSGIIFQFYNTDLVDVHNAKRGEDVVAFIDDMLMLARGKTLEEASSKLKDMRDRLGGGLEWL